LHEPRPIRDSYYWHALDLGLAGKVGLVTGASRGIGRSIALRLAAEGARVGICGRSPETLESALAELRAAGAEAHGVVADVTADGEVERFVDEAAAALGGVNMVIANVGSSGRGLLESTPEDWARTFDLNLFHAVRAIRAAVPYMQQGGGGSAVSIASISGWKPGPNAQYGAAKASEIFLAGALAWELAAARIRVNTVSPGSIIFGGGGWERLRAREPERFAEFERREFPWGRLGTPEEVADVVVFVLSERATWINGAHIAVDGAQGRPSAF
jgi:3-oxoacyl-[acyl-carrier protein] reductase